MSGTQVCPRPKVARREAFAAGRKPEADAKGPGEPGWGPRELRSRGGAARRAVKTIEGSP